MTRTVADYLLKHPRCPYCVDGVEGEQSTGCCSACRHRHEAFRAEDGPMRLRLVYHSCDLGPF